MAYHHDTGKKVLNQNKRTQMSVIKGCSPYMCYDTETGELLEPADYEPLIINLVKYVTGKTRQLVKERENELIAMLDDDNCPSQAVGAMQRYGISADISDLPKKVQQKYRINRLIMHKTFTEYKAYHNNEDPNKQPPSFDYKINLGAVDPQMALISFDEGHQVVALRWKCWDRDITLLFSYPAYVNNYDLHKFCLPTIQYDEDTGTLSYFLSVEENLSYLVNDKSAHVKTIVAGYDLGRKIPFVLKVMTDTGRVVATRKASGRLSALNAKRERLIANKKVLTGKLAAYDALGVRPARYGVYEREVACLREKIRVLGREVAFLTGAEIAGLCAFHGVHVVAGEDLSWVNDEHGSSRWVHGQSQECVAHSVRRVGVKHFTVSARGTSSTCTACGSRDTSCDGGSRVVRCKACGHEEDRDSTGAFNVARRRARVELRARVKALLVERARARAVAFPTNNTVRWCSGALAVRRGLAVDGVVLPCCQAFFITALLWNNLSVLNYWYHYHSQEPKI